MELIWKKKFAATTLDPEHKTFVVYVTALSINPGDEIHLSKRAQIAYLKADEALIKPFSKYTHFADVFFTKVGCRASQIYENQQLYHQISR